MPFAERGSGSRGMGVSVGFGLERDFVWGGLTIRVELEDVQVAVCVGGDDEELFAAGEEVCGDGFDVLQGFAELAELVGFLLRCESAIRFELFSLDFE